MASQEKLNALTTLLQEVVQEGQEIDSAEFPYIIIKGDIIWNIQPRMNSYVGWVCIQTGAPGLWSPFGKIGNS